MASTDHTEDTPAAYRDLLSRYQRINAIEDAAMYLSWDQQVMMPTGGAPARATQLSALSATKHELLVDEDVGEWLNDLSSADLSPSQAACYRELKWKYDRAASVPSELVEEITQVRSENQQIWQDAKAENDFETFAPRLEKLRDLLRERAAHIDPDAPPYEVLYEDSFPYTPIETIEAMFETLRSSLPPLIDDVRSAETELAQPFTGSYDAESQRHLSDAALDLLGFDRERGRLDTAPHPFMAGTQHDARVTTRFQESDPMDALMATIHEFGHASYQLGLPRDAYGTPLGDSRGSVHESQSRFWENHIARTKPFWDVFAETAAESLGMNELTAQEAYEDANRVRPDNLIRVEADELTYHLHIVLRCEIDRAFVNGDIDVMEIPALWNDKMEEYLGVRPETDRDGCLQDIHWTSGFANFQTYTFGSMIAAQLDQAIRAELDVDELVRERSFDPIMSWMRENIHQHGQRYETEDLVKQAVGESPSAEPFVTYVEDKFGDLYGI